MSCCCVGCNGAVVAVRLRLSRLRRLARITKLWKEAEEPKQEAYAKRRREYTDGWGRLSNETPADTGEHKVVIEE